MDLSLRAVAHALDLPVATPQYGSGGSRIEQLEAMAAARSPRQSSGPVGIQFVSTANEADTAPAASSARQDWVEVEALLTLAIRGNGMAGHV
jgi:hypothetical protein